MKMMMGQGISLNIPDMPLSRDMYTGCDFGKRVRIEAFNLVTFPCRRSSAWRAASILSDMALALSFYSDLLAS